MVAKSLVAMWTIKNVGVMGGREENAGEREDLNEVVEEEVGGTFPRLLPRLTRTCRCRNNISLAALSVGGDQVQLIQIMPEKERWERG